MSSNNVLLKKKKCYFVLICLYVRIYVIFVSFFLSFFIFVDLITCTCHVLKMVFLLTFRIQQKDASFLFQNNQATFLKIYYILRLLQLNRYKCRNARLQAIRVLSNAYLCSVQHFIISRVGLRSTFVFRLCTHTYG